jgi:hypothetical protein
MYIREIPEQDRAEVLDIMTRNKSNMLFNDADLRRLFYLYYRYIKTLGRGETVEKRMQKDLSCPACKGKVIMYFRNNFL